MVFIVFMCRRARHLMKDIQVLMPHSRKGNQMVIYPFSGSVCFYVFLFYFLPDTKLDRKDKLPVINEVWPGEGGWVEGTEGFVSLYIL